MSSLNFRMLRTWARWYSSQGGTPGQGQASVYKAKKQWPPDFSKLSDKHQFRLERRFRRRSQLKWARPRWNKAVKVVQWSSITLVLLYAVFVLDWETRKNIFQPARDWLDARLWPGWRGEDSVARRRKRIEAKRAAAEAAAKA